jgi:NitT/TauT family transport system substrate-binding protein
MRTPSVAPHRRSFAARAAVLAVVALLAACRGAPPPASPDASKPAPTPVRLALNWVPEPEFGGFYAARETGAYASHGLDVSITAGGAGAPVLQMVASGQADFGISASDEILLARAQGADVVGVYAIYQTSPQGIMAHPSHGATLAEVFSKGTVALEPGLPYAKFLKHTFGESPGARLVPYDGGVARFVADAEKTFAQQCFVTSEPLAARKQGLDPKVFLIADAGFNPYVGVVIVRRETLTTRRELVRQFVAASRAGWQSYLSDPAPANAVMAKLNTTMSPETFAAAAQAQVPHVVTEDTNTRGLGTMTRARWETLGRQLVTIGLLPSAPDVGAAFELVE